MSRKPNPRGGRASFQSLEAALRLAGKGLADGIVTAPISKEAWKSAAVPFHDHTEYLGKMAGAPETTMMLMAGELRAVLATRHIPLSEVPARLSVREIVSTGRQAARALRESLGISRPKLGLCALNPHAGEGGLLGSEEERLLKPAVKELLRSGLAISGPIPADTAWAEHAEGRYDALIALYHDQALIPLKLRSRYGVVNWTIGAPLVRTSPGHGTAFDVAGKGNADPTATIAAALWAARVCRRRMS
ncbi:MAG: 4-hydroxythreonine-4-phosphate dehydrogenase PdxA [Elusimicrobia bacterium]|nr:4-hydroxythreonine-4-phosphate dehydrogenase PdxA [Elusimicrobiota bacterium]